jgi:imidazolonepropionase-like amidohydrolase
MTQGKLGYRADIAFDGEQTIMGGALVLVEDGVIVGVEPGSAPAPDGWQVTYLPGTTMLPGLIDAHSHLCGNGQPDALDRLPCLSPDDLDEAVEAALTAQLAVGVTAVRDLGDHRWAVVDRHRKRPDGPTVVAAGPPITSVGGHCASMGGEASGIDELRRAVRKRADRGADLVKIMTRGGVMTASTDIRACQFRLEELVAVVDEAHRLGLPVTAHAHPLGVPPTTVLASATGLAARACGLADRTGRLRTGLDADLLLVDGDPTTDITAIRNLRTVVSRGQATHPNRTPDPPTRQTRTKTDVQQ